MSCRRPESPAKFLDKAVEWIWAQQSPDGGWHSKTHAVLRDGRVLTPYILFHLMQLPKAYLAGKEKAIQQAVDFIADEMTKALDENGSSLSDYPNYSASYALRVLLKANKDTFLQRSIRNYLLEQQYCSQRGISQQHLAFGGWGYGESKIPLGQHGHVDISHTRRVAEALFADPVIMNDSLLMDSLKRSVALFLQGVQRHPADARLYEGCESRKDIPYDGGFVASVVTLSTIKSEPVKIEKAGYHYPSYATATCDGFMTMHAFGMLKDRAYSDAMNWLRTNQQLETVDGLSPDDPEQWDEVMHYYHLAVRAEAMSTIDPEGAWKSKMRDILIREQTPEGYYINPIGGVNKEDDPLMATIFVIQAGNALSY